MSCINNFAVVPRSNVSNNYLEASDNLTRLNVKDLFAEIVSLLNFSEKVVFSGVNRTAYHKIDRLRGSVKNLQLALPLKLDPDLNSSRLVSALNPFLTLGLQKLDLRFGGVPFGGIRYLAKVLPMLKLVSFKADGWTVGKELDQRCELESKNSSRRYEYDTSWRGQTYCKPAANYWDLLKASAVWAEFIKGLDCTNLTELSISSLRMALYSPVGSDLFIALLDRLKAANKIEMLELKTLDTERNPIGFKHAAEILEILLASTTKNQRSLNLNFYIPLDNRIADILMQFKEGSIRECRLGAMEGDISPDKLTALLTFLSPPTLEKFSFGGSATTLAILELLSAMFKQNKNQTIKTIYLSARDEDGRVGFAEKEGQEILVDLFNSIHSPELQSLRLETTSITDPEKKLIDLLPSDLWLGKFDTCPKLSYLG